jgi:nuclear RNA export factor
MRDTRPAASAAANRPANLTQLQITGWKDSKFSTTDDGGVSNLTKFIERRGTIAQNKHAASAGIKKNTPVRIRKVRSQSRG